MPDMNFVAQRILSRTSVEDRKAAAEVAIHNLVCDPFRRDVVEELKALIIALVTVEALS